jgi:DNA helicase II / ATP-dependent DNA helicase PcrA
VNSPQQLTEFQEAAISADADRLLLVASAGSGKTEVLTRRVLRHLDESQGQTFRVLAITFTVRAAQNMEERLTASLAEEAWRVDADTVHGFALSWLMRFGQTVGIYPDTMVFSEDTDRLRLMAEVLAGLGELSADPRSLLQQIDDARTCSTDGNLILQPGQGLSFATLADVYDAYVAALESSSGLDFPGMLLKFIEACDAEDNFLRNFSSTYRHVLVDEGQDLSAAQAAVIARLADNGVTLFVVADDRQSINAFAGGSFLNAERLVGSSGTSHRLHLPDNFRCATEVVQSSERLATHLRSRPDKARAVAGAPPGKVRLAVGPTPDDEADVVAEWVRGLLRDGLNPTVLAKGEDPSVQPEEIAVIARARWLLDPVVERLKELGVDISIQTDAQTNFASPAARLLIEGLALIIAPTSSPSMRRMADDLRALDIDVLEEKAALMSAFGNSDRSDLIAIGGALPAMGAVASIGERLGSLRPAASEHGWIDDLGTIETYWTTYCSAVAPHHRDLNGFLRSIVRSQQTRPSDPGVRVLTIHKVKGLEFKAVCLIGAYDGALPDYRASTPAAIDEERKAFYVAMTRAARELLITYPEATVDRYGRPHRQVASQFAFEAGIA